MLLVIIEIIINIRNVFMIIKAIMALVIIRLVILIVLRIGVIINYEHNHGHTKSPRERYQ